ncbi:MAG: hypothetical protein PHN80_14405 [Hespellia sp.]|nr:hypothetical protein [Hespellia sp.]
MSQPAFFRTMNRGQHGEHGENEVEQSSYCIFFDALETPVVKEHISGDAEQLVLELCYGEDKEDSDSGAFRLRQVRTNIIIEESFRGRFREFLEDKSIKYMGQLIMYALQFRVRDISVLIETCQNDMRRLEDRLDNCIDNMGTYDILDFRRRYTAYGRSIISIKEIFAYIGKGYYTLQMQNSYVFQGQVELEFDFLENFYYLQKTTLIKDLDTYTSIINNNINRNTRLLNIVSLSAVILDFTFGGIFQVQVVPRMIVGIMLAVTAFITVFYYRRGKRYTRPVSAKKKTGLFSVDAEKKAEVETEQNTE